MNVTIKFDLIVIVLSAAVKKQFSNPIAGSAPLRNAPDNPDGEHSGRNFTKSRETLWNMCT